VKYQVLLEARRNCKNKGRQKYEYQCASCNKWFKATDVQIDHIVPCGSLRSYNDLPIFVERLFCEPDGLQVLCKPCHQEKTNEERKSAKDSTD
jgi:5-methylcytosine-specific restriction endonuclease McrA